MRGAIVFSLILVGLAGCKSQPPAADPFSNHPIVPPPGTGTCPTSPMDPGYAPVASPGLAPPLGQPGLPTNTIAPPAGTALGNGWTAATPTGQNPLAPNAAAGSMPTYTGGAASPTNGAAGSMVIPPSIPPGNGPVIPTSPGIPSSSYPVNGAVNRGPAGYGTVSPGATGGPGSAPATENTVFGGSAPHIIPPPPTATAGGNVNSLVGPSPGAPGTAVFPPGNPYGFAGGGASPRTTPASVASPIPGTPRPTPSQVSSPIGRPAAAIAGSVPPDYRSPRPVDDAVQPIRSPLGPTNGVLANSTVATTPTVPRPMQPPATAYGVPTAMPPCYSPIQTVVIEPNWQPCDGYADGAE